MCFSMWSKVLGVKRKPVCISFLLPFVSLELIFYLVKKSISLDHKLRKHIFWGLKTLLTEKRNEGGRRLGEGDSYIHNFVTIVKSRFNYGLEILVILMYILVLINKEATMTELISVALERKKIYIWRWPPRKCGILNATFSFSIGLFLSRFTLAIIWCRFYIFRFKKYCLRSLFCSYRAFNAAAEKKSLFRARYLMTSLFNQRLKIH